MTTFGQTKQLIGSCRLSRDFNGHESEFIARLGNTIIASNPIEGGVLRLDLNLWLSWPLWNFRHLLKSFKIGDDYVCMENSGKVSVFRYFGNGIFSRLSESNLKFLNSEKTNFKKFHPYTVNLSMLKRVGDIIVRELRSRPKDISKKLIFRTLDLN